MGEAYIGDTPQANADREQMQPRPDIKPDYTVAPTVPPEFYNFTMTATHVSVSKDGHGDQFDAMGWNDFARPYAYGRLELHYRWMAVWHIEYSNMSLHLVEKRLKRYTKDQGWDWGGVVGQDGMPFNMRSLKQAAVPGIGEINPGVKDWKNDEWAGMQQFDNPGDHQTDTPFYGFSDPDEDFPMSSPRTCSECGMLCLNYNEWRKHTLNDHANPDRNPPADPQPVVDLDDVLPAGFDEAVMDKTVQRQSALIWKLAAPRSGQPTIQGPIPFIYDIETDRIFVGHPGERHSDIQGRFTPGGIIEGLYDPKGNVQIKTDTDMPYTVRHMAELWYAMHPELQIKSIFLMIGQKKYKLASSNIGFKVRSLTATDPAAWAAYQALEEAGGNVYAVGGVVRDVVLGKTPKDVDLMVQGIDVDDVQDVLERLPGRVDYTGKQFGVFRYRDPEGNEAEIALPRTERSTGAGHRDFEVYTDPYISVGEDLARRDFTGNAMAVNLTTGDLIDPYHGSQDLKGGTLRTVSDRSFPEDPLRILRAFSQVSRHGLDPAPETYHDLAAHAGSLRELPQERLQMELDKLMSGSDPAKAIDLMEATGVLQHVLPEVAATYGFDQKNGHHKLLLNDHLKAVLRHIATITPDVDLRWAALLHDIGKPTSQWIGDDGVGHYYQKQLDDGTFVGQNHDEVGAEMARDLLTRLKFPNDRIARITHLIRHHMFPTFQSQSGARKFINRVGDEHVDDLMKLREADVGGKGTDEWGHIPTMQQYVQAVRDAGEPTDLSQLAINGRDLIAAGFKPGPEMGQILRYLTERVIEDPSLNSKETLLQLAQQSASDEPFTAVANTLFQETAQFPVTGNNEVWRRRVPFYVGADGRYVVGVPGQDHTTMQEAETLEMPENSGQYQGHVIFDPEYGEVVAWPEMPVTDEVKNAVLNEARNRWNQRTANILDPIKDELDPDVFNHSDEIDPQVKPKIIEWVKKKVYKTMVDAGWPDPSKYLNLVLTGSLTTYQWSAESDFDISLWVDVKKFPEWVRADLIAMMIENCDGTIVPGTTHPMQCFVVDSTRFKKEDLYKPGLRSGYDLDAGEWLVLPEKNRSIDVSKMWPEHVAYARMCVDKMKMMLRYDKYAVKIYWDFLHRQRFLDQRAGKGDYALSNIVYKMLSNEGLFPYISEATGEYIA